MGERVYINDLNPITNIQESSTLLVDQGGYKKISYNDFLVDVVGTVKADYNKDWNATVIDGVDVKSESPNEGDVIRYNSSTHRYENTKLDSSDIDWTTVDVNRHKFLQVDDDGVVKQEHIYLPSLRADNNYSDGFFLRVNSVKQIEAVKFDPDEFVIDASYLEGNSISDLDTRYMRGGNNLSELTNKSASRDNLDVLSESQNDARYVAKVQNLNDISDKAAAFSNIKQPATTAYSGVIEIATSNEVQSGLRSDIAVVPSTLNDNYYNRADSDGRFAGRSQNLSDLSDYNAARNTLDIYSKNETRAIFLQQGLNLSELSSVLVARDNLDVYSTSEVDSLMSGVSSVVTGTIVAIATTTVPSGYLKCNGSLLNVSAYPELFAALGRRFGGSSGNGTFRIPDLRGEFIRGWDDGRGVDNNRVLGEHQNESFKRHSHSGSTNSTGNHKHTGSTSSAGKHTHTVWFTYDGAGGTSYIGGTRTGGSTYKHTSSSSGSHKHSMSLNNAGKHSHSLNINDTGGSETRPRNVAMLYIIKF